jgi:hypothetical protein
MSAYNCNKLLDIVSEEYDHIDINSDIALKYSSVFAAMMKLPLSYSQTVIFGQSGIDIWNELGFSDDVVEYQILGNDLGIRRYVALSRLLKSFTLDFMIKSSTSDKLMYCKYMLLALDGIPEYLQSVMSTNMVLWARFSALNNAVLSSGRIEYQSIWDLIKHILYSFDSISVKNDWTEIQNEIDVSISLLVIHLLIVTLMKDREANIGTSLDGLGIKLKSVLNYMF